MDGTEQAAPAPHIAVVVPCYNEESHVAEVVAGIPAALVQTIIVVDDGSTDGTRERILDLDDTRVVPVLHDRNGGVGRAMVSGYRAALERGADICIKMDGDGQMSPVHLPSLIEPLLRGDADYVKGNRFGDLEALSGMPRMRLIGNSVLSFLTKLASGYWSILDPVNGYTAITREMLEALSLDRLSKGFFFETSILIELNIIGAVVRDVDVPARYGGEESSLGLASSAMRFPFLLVAGMGRRFFWRHLIRDFNPLTLCLLAGLPLLSFGLLFGLYRWGLSIRTGTPATAGTVLLAALPVILGFQCLLTALVLDTLYQPSRPLSPRLRGAPDRPGT